MARSYGSGMAGWAPLADPPRTRRRRGGRRFLALAGAGLAALVMSALLAYLLATDPAPGLSGASLTALVLAAAVVVVLCVRAERSGALALFRTVAEYGVVALLVVLLIPAAAPPPVEVDQGRPAAVERDHQDQDQARAGSSRRASAMPSAPGTGWPTAGARPASRPPAGRPRPRPPPLPTEEVIVMWENLPSHLRTGLAVAFLAVIGVAAASFYLSFLALREVAANPVTGWGEHAWVFPLCVDAALIAAEVTYISVSMIRGINRALPLFMVVLFGAVTVWFNVERVPAEWRVVTALPPVAGIFMTC